MVAWSKPNDIKKKIEHRWKKGDILRHSLLKDDLFPLEIKLDCPSPNELGLYFSDVIKWVSELKNSEKTQDGYGYMLIEKETNYRTIGRNSIPVKAIIPTLDDAIWLIHKQKEVRLFNENAQLLLKQWGILKHWILKYPFKIVNELGVNIDRILIVLEWFENNPKHYRYLRQLDIMGIDTKFIESNKTIISELLSIILPEGQVNINAKTFEERFYLKSKPKMIRFRLLDSNDINEGFSDITVSIEEFANWQPDFDNVFFTENEINFLSFPPVKKSCIIFGKGYGVEIFKLAKWIREKKVYYWGDIDTHGFNILSMARGFLPNLRSFLMTEDILLNHRALWVDEIKPHLADINNLTYEEHELACKLQTNYFGEGVRLEQERIAYSFVEKFVADFK